MCPCPLSDSQMRPKPLTVPSITSLLEHEYVGSGCRSNYITFLQNSAGLVQCVSPEGRKYDCLTGRYVYRLPLVQPLSVKQSGGLNEPADLTRLLLWHTKLTDEDLRYLSVSCRVRDLGCSSLPASNKLAPE